QWNEGDVSCSVVRRVAMPDASFALDGLLETFLTVLGQMEVFPGVIRAENRRHLPFLLSTTILMEAVKAGAGREDAHAAIKEHAVATVGDLRAGLISENDLPVRLAADERLGLSAETIDSLLAEGESRVGAASRQVDVFIEHSKSWAERYPEAADYKPAAIL
ncbi:MAG: adenylosuccinate lyase, partial [Opitutales bacterium]